MFHVTERLLLRPVWPEDAHALFAGIADQGVVRNLARAPWPYSIDHARQFVSLIRDERYPRFLITRPDATGSSLIGCVGIDESDGGVELGYWIARQHWSRGYATEAARGAIAIARVLGHERMVAGHFTDNPASGRVLRKLGFQATGETVMRHSCGRGEEAACVRYCLDLAEDAEVSLKAA